MSLQHTLTESFTLRGKGLHTGLQLTLTCMPAPEDHGYRVQRIDLPGHPIIEALATNVVATPRGTILGQGEARCSTVEHALAAFYALGVDNVLFQIDGPEFPILDGSAQPYVNEIMRVGLSQQTAERSPLVVDDPVEVRDEATGGYLRIEPADHFALTCHIAFDGEVLKSQQAELPTLERFTADIAAARTFVFVREIEPLLNAGLIKGGDLDNAIVIYENEIAQERIDQLCRLTGVEHHDAHQLGYLQHRPLVWENEPARHKLLDVIGDLSLVGRPIWGHITAYKPGHAINNLFAKALIERWLK